MTWKESLILGSSSLKSKLCILLKPELIGLILILWLSFLLGQSRCLALEFPPGLEDGRAVGSIPLSRRVLLGNGNQILVGAHYHKHYHGEPLSLIPIWRRRRKWGWFRQPHRLRGPSWSFNKRVSGSNVNNQKYHRIEPNRIPPTKAPRQGLGDPTDLVSLAVSLIPFATPPVTYVLFAFVITNLALAGVSRSRLTSSIADAEDVLDRINAYIDGGPQRKETKVNSSRNGTRVKNSWKIRPLDHRIGTGGPHGEHDQDYASDLSDNPSPLLDPMAKISKHLSELGLLAGLYLLIRSLFGIEPLKALALSVHGVRVLKWIFGLESIQEATGILLSRRRSPSSARAIDLDHDPDLRHSLEFILRCIEGGDNGW